MIDMSPAQWKALIDKREKEIGKRNEEQAIKYEIEYGHKDNRQMKNKITRHLVQDKHVDYGLGGNVIGVIQFLTDKLNSIPEECRQSFDLYISGERYWLSYLDDETDEEEAERLLLENEKERIKQEEELELLAELKAKYESPSRDLF